VWGNGGVALRIHNFRMQLLDHLVLCMLQVVGGTLDSGQLHISDSVPRDRADGVHWMGGRVDLRAGVYDVGKGPACTNARNQTLVIHYVMWSP